MNSELRYWALSRGGEVSIYEKKSQESTEKGEKRKCVNGIVASFRKKPLTSLRCRLGENRGGEQKRKR